MAETAGYLKLAGPPRHYTASRSLTRTTERLSGSSSAAPASSSGQQTGEKIGLNKHRTHFLRVRAVSLQCPSATQTPERLLARPGSFFKPRTAANNGAVSQASRSIIYMEFRLPMRIPAVGAFGAILKTAAQGPTPGQR